MAGKEMSCRPSKDPSRNPTMALPGSSRRPRLPLLLALLAAAVVPSSAGGGTFAPKSPVGAVPLPPSIGSVNELSANAPRGAPADFTDAPAAPSQHAPAATAAPAADASTPSMSMGSLQTTGAALGAALVTPGAAAFMPAQRSATVSVAASTKAAFDKVAASVHVLSAAASPISTGMKDIATATQGGQGASILSMAKASAGQTAATRATAHLASAARTQTAGAFNQQPASRPAQPAALPTKPVVRLPAKPTAKVAALPPPPAQAVAAPTIAPKAVTKAVEKAAPSPPTAAAFAPETQMNLAPGTIAPEGRMSTNANHPDQSLDAFTHENARMSSGTMDSGGIPTKTAEANLYLRPFQSRVPSAKNPLTNTDWNGLTLANGRPSQLTDPSNQKAMAEEANFEKLEARKTEVFFGDTSEAAFTPQDGAKLHSTESYDRYKPRAQLQAPIAFSFSGRQSVDGIRKQGRASLLSRYQPFGPDAKDEFSIDADDVSRFEMENSTQHDTFRADVYNPVLNEVSSFGPAHADPPAAMQEPVLRHEEAGYLHTVYSPLNPSAAGTPHGMSVATVAALNPTVAALERRDSASQTYLTSITKQVSTLTQATVDLNRELRQLHLLSKHRR